MSNQGIIIAACILLAMFAGGTRAGRSGDSTQPTKRAGATLSLSSLYTGILARR